MINNFKDLCEYLGVTEEDADGAFYDATDCGGHIEDRGSELYMGTIVEGSDSEYDRYIPYPFTEKDYEREVKEMEAWAEEEWFYANVENPMNEELDATIDRMIDFLKETYPEREDDIAYLEEQNGGFILGWNDFMNVAYINERLYNLIEQDAEQIERDFEITFELV